MRRLCQVYLGPPLPACRDYLSAEAEVDPATVKVVCKRDQEMIHRVQVT